MENLWQKEFNIIVDSWFDLEENCLSSEDHNFGMHSLTTLGHDKSWFYLIKAGKQITLELQGKEGLSDLSCTS